MMSLIQCLNGDYSLLGKRRAFNYLDLRGERRTERNKRDKEVLIDTLGLLCDDELLSFQIDSGIKARKSLQPI